MSDSESDVELPPLPAKVYKPQSKGNVGVGKLYKDKEAFRLAVEDYQRKKAEREVLVAEREVAMKQQRERRRVRQRTCTAVESNFGLCKECARKQYGTPSCECASQRNLESNSCVM